MKATLAVLTLLFSQFAFAQDAAMFRGNPQHTGVYEAAGVPKFSRVKWKFQTGGRSYSSPAISNGTAYVGSNDHFLYAVDLASGAQKWKFETASRVTSSPAVSGDTVFFDSMDADFYAVDAATGKLKWKYKTAGERRYTATHLHGAMPESEAMPDPFDFYLSSVFLDDPACYRESQPNSAARSGTVPPYRMIEPESA